MSSQNVAFYAALALAAGAMIPIMAGLSGSMGRTLGNPSFAAMIVATGAFLMVLAYTFATGAMHASPSLLQQLSPAQWLSGFVMAFYISAITFLAPRFGVGNSVMLVVAAQIASSATIDHFGLFGAPHRPIDSMRALGLAVMIVGVVIAQLAANKPAAH